MSDTRVELLTGKNAVIGKLLWQEDDATCGIPDHESPSQAWFKIFGVEFNKDMVFHEVDHGDSIDRYCHVGGGKISVLVSSYAGNGAIYEVLEADAPPPVNEL